MDHKLTFESMTALTVGRYSVRVWRDEEDNLGSAEFKNGDLEDLAIQLTDEYCGNPVVIAREFCKLDRVAAVEVLDMNKCGVVVYKNWP